jgi:nicotinamidase-related amidase
MTTAADKFRLSRSQAALLVVDVQERLCAAMEPGALDRMVNRTRAAIKGAQALGLPVVYTEQYPQGLGPTLGAVKELLSGSSPIEKVRFSCAIPQVISALKRSQVLIAGMEAHVCVFQTARDLAELSFTPYLLADAVLSRSEQDRQIGLSLCREVGAVTTTVESALFDLLGEAGTPEFKMVSAAVK